MINEEKYGYLKLAKRSLAVLTASLGALFAERSVAASKPETDIDSTKDLNYKTFQDQVLKSKLVLKINSDDPEKFLLTMHRSHSSHSSHRSHSSHSSHYSSTPSYTPPTKTPTPPPETPTETETLSSYELGSRLMYGGCEGTDVQELQEMLTKLGYDVIVTGYYGEKTTEAVKKYQKKQELKADGKVNKKTLTALRKSLSEN